MDVEDLYPMLRRQVRGCPEDSMGFYLVQAAREFCFETWWLRRSMTAQTVAPVNGVPTQLYQCLPPANEEVIAIKHGQIESLPPNQNISPLRFVYPTMVNPNVGAQQPFGICYVPNNTYALVPPPDNVYTHTLELITQPVEGSAYIPDELGRLWDRALRAGALSNLYITNKSDPWYSEKLAAASLMQFNQEIVKARTQAAFDFTPNQKNWIGGSFAQLQSTRF